MLLIPVKLNVNDALTRADIRMMEKKIKKKIKKWHKQPTEGVKTLERKFAQSSDG